MLRSGWFMAVAWVLLMVRPAFADGDLRASLLACRAIAGVEDRAQCYDALSDRVAAIASATSASSPNASVDLGARAAQLAQREADLKAQQAAFEAERKGLENSMTLFGISLSSDPAVDRFTTSAAGLAQDSVERDEDGSVKAINAAIREFFYSEEGKLTAVLDNGQAWRQTGGEAIQLTQGRKTPYRVRIARGALGSFQMSVDGSNRVYKVRRIDGYASRRIR